MKLAYHVSHEQFPPAELLAFARNAERAGFDGFFSSDHLQPWSPSQGNSSHIWSWLGAALTATTILGAGIVVPGVRHHPVMVAQALATIANMFPGRLPWVALGSGEALNEAVVGPFPEDRAERNRLLARNARVIRQLLRGETVNEGGEPAVANSRVWCRFTEAPLLFGAAISPETARSVAGWADGLLTVGSRREVVGPVIDAFRSAGGSRKPVAIKVDLCIAESAERAIAEAHRNWRFALGSGADRANLRQPEDFVRATSAMTLEEVAQKVLIARRPAEIPDRLRELAPLNAAWLDLHHVGPDQGGFLETMRAELLERIRQATTR